MARNWDRATMRFAAARYIDRERMLDVTFENGDHFLVAVETVLPGGSDHRFGRGLAPAAWARMRIAETGDVLEIPAGDTLLEIPWDRIRSLVDPDFRAHLAEQADERARRIGRRIRDMRLEAGLTPAALAEKVSVSRETIGDLEAGRLEPRADLIEYIAGVLGHRLKDFAGE